MSMVHSFTEYVNSRFEDDFWKAAENYVMEQFDVSRIDFRTIRSPGEPELTDVEVKHVWTESDSEMDIRFDVALEITIEIPDRNHHYDDSEECHKWLMLRCKGDLDKNLDDFEIYECEEFTGKNRLQDPLDDSLVPIIHKEQLDEEAEKFLKKYYPKALLEPTAINIDELVRNIGLTLKVSNISKDASVFGRCFFYDCEMTLYNFFGEPHTELIPAGTVLVDFESTFMSVEGATHNTIVHECVHWDLHKKAFALARLYDNELTNIGCKVVGGVADNKRDSFDWMEWQANALTPRIMMPIGMFKKQADSLIAKFHREDPDCDIIDIIEPIIERLADTFGVSKLAAKIRMLDAGYDEAGGALIYLDGHYVKTNKAPKGYLKENQTFAISAKDALLQGLVNRDLREKYLPEGRYIFVDNHFVLNTPKYVEADGSGELQLTRYARNHMDECCLVFDLSVKGPYETQYHHECFLNRDRKSTVEFNIKFNDGYEHSPEKQKEILRKTVLEEAELLRLLKNDYVEALNQVIDWKNKQREDELKEHPHRDISKITALEISKRTNLNVDTVRRTLRGEPTSVNTLVLICLALHLPYSISSFIINNSPYRLNIRNENHAFYDFALRALYPKTVEEVRNFLIENNIEPL